VNPSVDIKFGSLPLHDAILKEICIDWSARTCVAEVEAFVIPDQQAQARKIVWQKVSKITMPHEDPWGASVFINTARQEGDCYIIEMQSGDEIRINAGHVAFL
jgi:hypothetical protein